MVYRDAPHLRRAFDLKSEEYFGSIFENCIIALANGSQISSSTAPVADSEGMRVKWHIIRKLFPFHAQLKPTKLEDDLSTGGNRTLPVTDQDTRLCDLMCLVNDSLTSKSVDLISYHRIH